MKLNSLIIAETDNWVAVNKPSGLLSIPDREGKEISLKVMLKEKYGNIFTVHRIDKDTSGVIIFAKNETEHAHLSAQFDNRKTTKIYQGLVNGTLVTPSGTINAPIAEHPAKNGTMMVHRNGKESITDYLVLEDFGIYSWMQFQIHTGRTHQIRVHMQSIGHPIVADPLYGDGKGVFVSAIRKKFKLAKSEEEERPILGRLALHAASLTIEDSKGATLELAAPLPKDIQATLQQLQKRKK